MNYTLGRILLTISLLGLFAVLLTTYNNKPPLRSSIVKVLNFTRNGGGTGFSTLSNGKPVIVTNSHVCEVAENNFAVIEQANGKVSIKRIIANSPLRDLCVLEGVDVPPLPLGTQAPYMFEKLHIMGHPLLKPAANAAGEYTGDGLIPFGMETDKDGTCKNGTLQQSIFGSFCVLTMELSYTTIPVYPGNSGSPVLNRDGEVIGVVNSTGPDSMGMFIPLTYLKEILESAN